MTIAFMIVLFVSFRMVRILTGSNIVEDEGVFARIAAVSGIALVLTVGVYLLWGTPIENRGYVRILAIFGMQATTLLWSMFILSFSVSTTSASAGSESVVYYIFGMGAFIIPHASWSITRSFCHSVLTSVFITTAIAASDISAAPFAILGFIMLLPLLYTAEATSRRQFASQLIIKDRCDRQTSLELELAASLAENRLHAEIKVERGLARVQVEEVASMATDQAVAARALTLSVQLDRAELEIEKLASQRVLLSDHPMNVLKKIPRSRKLREAWADGADWQHSKDEPMIDTGPKMPSLAITSQDETHFEATILKKDGLGRVAKIKAGSHAFVCMEGEQYLRMGSKASPFGSAAGHPQLALESPALYAGEIEFGDQQNILRWSNLSGTYKAADQMAYQAGLPLDKFWAVQVGAPTEEDRRRCISFKNSADEEVWLRKILDFSETDFAMAHAKWLQSLESMLENNSEAKACDVRLRDMTAQLRNAVGRYGYLSQIER
jgi:hypothetical protein